MTTATFKKYLSESLSKRYSQGETQSIYFLLLEAYTQLSKTDILINPEQLIDNQILIKLTNAVDELVLGRPLQYILGYADFCGSRFLVDESTLIPRQETEELVDWIVSQFTKNQSINILDIGCGSGCIAISLAKMLPQATVSAIDVSEKALAIAKKNAEKNEVTIHFIQKNILTTNELPTNYDLIVSNPPYIRVLEKAEIQENVLNHEPHLALFVPDENPLIFYEKIADLSQKYLSENGQLFFEINQYLGKETVDFLHHQGFSSVELRQDLNGNDRMIRALR